MFNYSEDRRIIRQAINDNKLVVFIGAGASVNSGIPLWKDAIGKIYEKIGFTTINENETIKIPQLYFNSRGEKEYNELIKDIFKYNDKKSNEIHELVVKLNPCHVITTNYDDFLENAFINNGEFLDVVQKDSDIPYCKNNRMIIKMHGGFIYNNFVLKEDDYLNYSKNYALIETFIKALIAKNIVLFVGYSYNDPDTKQIFNWTKSILGENFQRAYFLDARNCYDLNTINYYKHLGINIIYASEQIDNFEKENVFENTVNLLEYIINDEQETDIVNILYNAFNHLFKLNYIMVQYVTPTLWKVGVRYENGDLALINNKTEELFKTLNENYKQKKLIELQTIKETLEKTIIKNVYFDKNIICNFKEYPNGEIFEDIDNQNYISIRNYIDSLHVLIELDNKQQLCIAYCYSELQEYKKSYEIVKKLSLSFKQRQDYVWYFITEFNRLHIGETINSSIDKIDLGNILYSNAENGKNENLFLKDLEDFNLIYKMLSKVIKTSEKVEKDTTTNYVFGSGTANIDILGNYVKDFYNYLKYNFLMINNYTEVKDVFKQYINAVFFSHCKEEKEFSDGMFGTGKNKVLKEISPFVIIIICKYIDKKSLEQILHNNYVIKIKLSEQAEDKIFEIFDNYLKAIKKNIMIRDIKDKIFVILKILSIINLSRERIIFIINNVNTLVSKKFFCDTDYNEINNFIVTKYNFDKDIFSSDLLVSILNTICNGFRMYTWEDTDLHYLYSMFKNVGFMIKDNYPNVKVDDVYSEAILNSNNVEFFPDLFPIVTIKIKKRIKSEVLLRLQDDDFNYKLYFNSIIAGIIKPSKEMENKLFNKVKQIYSEQNPAMKVFPDPLERILNYSMNLLLNGKLIAEDRFKQYFKDISWIEFLSDMDNFDYNKFEISWFTKANGALKNTIIKNKTAFKEIKKLYKETLFRNDYDRLVLIDYLQFFD